MTLPIHNGPGSLRNVLWLNEETGKWEEVFYTVADDGKSCTAYVDHFSLFSSEESTDDREQFYYDVTKYLKGSVFVEYDVTASSKVISELLILFRTSLAFASSLTVITARSYLTNLSARLLARAFLEGDSYEEMMRSHVEGVTQLARDAKKTKFLTTFGIMKRGNKV